MSNTKLKKIAQELSQKILSNQHNNFSKQPFQHLFINDAFNRAIAEDALKSFPVADAKGWDFSNDDVEIKYRSKWTSEFDIPDGLIEIIRVFNSSIILEALSKIFNIPKLMPDPYFTGGGLNTTKRGGKLDVHVDGNYHDKSGMHRRVNLILFLSERWEEHWGGEFCLYDNTGEKCIKKIAPLFNRLLAFDTHDKSFHGLPEPINFPEDVNRNSIILYYYTVEERPSEKVSISEPHSALWKSRGLRDKENKKTRKHF